MNTRHTFYLVLIIVAASHTAFTSGVRSLKYSGSAVDLHSKTFYYTEEHEEVTVNGVHTSTGISYKDQSGTVFANKTISFSGGQTAPSFLQKDLRDGSMEGAQVSGNTVTLVYKKNTDTPQKSKTLTVPSPLVVDGGFNYFVKKHWAAMLLGKQVTFNFAVPSQLDYFAFRIQKQSETIYNGKKAIIIKMDADSYIIRQLVDPVLLTYDTETMRLMKYEGISNISDSNGKNYQVQLTYPTVGP